MAPVFFTLQRAGQAGPDSKQTANCKGKVTCGTSVWSQAWEGAKDYASDTWGGLKYSAHGLAAVGAVVGAHSHSDDPEENQEEQATPEYQQNLKDAKDYLKNTGKGLVKTALMLTGPGAIYFTYKSITSGKMHEEYEKGGGGAPGVARAAGYAGAEAGTTAATAAAGGVAGRVLGGGAEAGAVGAEGAGEAGVGGAGGAAGPVKAGEPVSVATGEYLETWRDFVVAASLSFNGARYMGLRLTAPRNGSNPLGRCQTSMFDEAFDNPEFGKLEFYQADGKRIRFDRPINFLSSANAAYPYLDLRAPWLRQLELRDQNLIKHFRQYDDGLYRLEKLEDLNGNAIVFRRDTAGWLDGAETTDGLALAFSNDANGRRIRVVLIGIDGSRLELARYAYDASGRMTAAECAFGMSVRYYWHPERDLLLRWHNTTLRSETHFTYDDEGRVLHTRTNGIWNDDRFRYDPVNRETTYLPSGEERLAQRFRYDENDNVTHETDALGHTLQRIFDAAGFETALTDANGNTTTKAYDIRGNVRRHVDAEGRATTYACGRHGALDMVIDGAGNVRRCEHDSRGNLLSETCAEGYTTRFVRDERGRLLLKVSPDGSSERRVWDSHGRLESITDPKGGMSRFAYDGFGRATEIIDALGNVTCYEYEAGAGGFATPTAVVRADGVRLARAYSCEGTLASVTDGEGRTWTYVYGAFDLLKAIEDPKGGRLTFGYDCEGRITSVTNQTGRIYSLIRDAAGNVVAEEDFDGRRTEYTRDPGGRLIETKKPDGVRMGYAYDRSDKLTSIKCYAADDPDNARVLCETHYWYDGRGLLIRASNQAALIEFGRDRNGRIISESVNGRKIEIKLDARGNRIERRIGTDQIGERLVRYAHDPLGLLTSLTIDDHAPLIFTHDALGRETRREAISGFRLDQSWDAIGQLRSQSAGYGASGLTGLAAARAQSTPGTVAERHYVWDKAGAPVSIDDLIWGETRYCYDANGQIAEASFGDGLTEKFEYDAARNVAGVKLAGPAIGPGVGGLLSWQSTPGGVVRLARGPNGEMVALTHDACGRVVTRRVERKGFRPKTWRYGWDALDHLVSCETPDGDTWFYSYDAFGRRLTKVRKMREHELAWAAQKFGSLVPKAAREATKIWTWPAPPPDALADDHRPPIIGTQFSWDLNVVSQTAPLRLDGSADWAEATSWHFSPDSFRPVAKQTADDTLLEIVTDHLGTAREMLDEEGRLRWAASFSTWGVARGVQSKTSTLNGNRHAIYPRDDTQASLSFPLSADGDAYECPLRFPGQWADESTGLNYNRYRHYDEFSGQYMSPDLLGLRGGSRPQAYVATPNQWCDPLGLVTTYSDFANRSVVGDDLEGHEAWQHASLKKEGLATNRLSTDASKNNPVIVLERELHKKVNKAQRSLDVQKQTPQENIKENADILRAQGVDGSSVDQLEKNALDHAKSLGYE